MCLAVLKLDCFFSFYHERMLAVVHSEVFLDDDAHFRYGL